MGYPDLDFDSTQDAVDTLIADLNQAMGDELTFERDALDVERPDDWGAVEVVDTVNEYADGHCIDQYFVLDIWAGVSDRGSGWLALIEGVLQDAGASYTLVQRAYLHDLKKVIWQWRATLDGTPPETEG